MRNQPYSASPPRVAPTPLWLVTRLIAGALLVVGTLTGCTRVQPADTPPLPTSHPLAATDTLPLVTFQALLDTLSEPSGYFDTDNLISNEASYAHVLGPLRTLAEPGGAYLGVGPDQNYAYIAELQPPLAFLIDIRRDNALLHLFYKALFGEANDRAGFAELLFGLPEGSVSPQRTTSAGLSAEELAAAIDGAGRSPEAAQDARERVRTALDALSLARTAADRATIQRFHDRFMTERLDLRFTSHGRSPQPYYPTLRGLLTERDLDGHPGHYLASEARFQAVKALHDRHRILPITGDLAGNHALRAVGDVLRAQELTVGALYTSNVEFYLARARTYGAFVDNLAALPTTERSLLIRSYFNRYRRDLPQTVPGYASTQLIQPIPDLIAGYRGGRYPNYSVLVRDGSWRGAPAEARQR